ncbi:hypothetical protein BOW53_00015 [Solemya pervernicosa gill symbiont]|uniref:SoxXA-binding protein n=2 Tax=Gammaproteobacteria incertae sedis TaxID=118884 RepID=A0A1T2LBB4_9GAMM|nr:hypothetical protein BOW53_00015 [Solemya pervernicosa gill symbiont]QKQ28150.1 SoxXA-binding protein [Candidatus Reidiella endopervernicosa]
MFATQQKEPVQTTSPAKPAAEVAKVEPAPAPAPVAMKPSPAAPIGATAAEAIEAAKAAAKKAASVKGEWRDTGKIIKGAVKAAEAGDEAKAIKLAHKAQLQGELGYIQATTQTNITTPSYLQQ